MPVIPPTTMNETEILSAKTLISVAILFLYTISSPIMRKFNFQIIHESGICMIIGFLVSAISIAIWPKTSFVNTLYFNDAVFFNFILPPIIFSAGYNLKRRSFFKYITFTLLFGILGTIISFLITASISYLLNQLGAFTLGRRVINLSIQEILLFSSVISSTDTLAALTFIKEEQDLKLFSILFGEGIFNDAVSIVIYKIISDFALSKEEFTSTSCVFMIGDFLRLFIISLVLGGVCGLSCTLFLKKMKIFKLHRVQECSIIIFFSFFSYSFAQITGLSPIISLLFSAMFMSHYAFYNLSFQAREESSIVSKIMSNIAEAFLFTYLGLTFISISHKSFSLDFLIWEFLILIFSRYTSVYSISVFINLLISSNTNSNETKLKTSERGIISFAGSIRGAIAFGLAMSINTGSIQNDEVLVSTTLILVVITTIFFGGLLNRVIKYYRNTDIQMKMTTESIFEIKECESQSSCVEYTYSHPNNKFEEYKLEEISNNIRIPNKSIGCLERMKNSWIVFENNIVKPWLLYNWPQCKIEHEEITNRISQIFSEYQKLKFSRHVSFCNQQDEALDICIINKRKVKIDEEENLSSYK